ncbi:MAG: hypothetical protein A2138_21590 [Deltaproteobacteria bacterium RBG_16_71_12]|nr:MAG: hypothetical protein A2138_21590 [Deltaproteobacteria bacterium RBG_16_71_12]
MTTDKLGTGADLTRGAALPGGVAISAVYVHVPYCRRRCPYCDFSIEIRSADGGFAAAVGAELLARAAELPWPAHSLSFGGGTPSALPADALAELVGAVRGHGLAPDAEVSLEANPEDVSAELAHAWRAAGVTRVSLGVQSFDDGVLAWLGRAHRADQARAAVQAVRDAGIPHLGLDLIVGVPVEGGSRVERDVEEAARLGVGHVSAYLLTLEPGTPLVRLIARGTRAPLDEERQVDAYQLVQQLLVACGFAQYEVSSFAQAGEESRHNRLYWAHRPYLGLGPGAHSMRELPDGAVLRRHTTARLDRWLAAPDAAAHDDETLGPAHALREAVAFGLRDVALGVDLDVLAARRRADPSPILAALAAARERGEVAGIDGGRRFRLTALGARFADRVARDVLAAHGDRR